MTRAAPTPPTRTTVAAAFLAFELLALLGALINRNAGFMIDRRDPISALSCMDASRPDRPSITSRIADGARLCLLEYASAIYGNADIPGRASLVNRVSTRRVLLRSLLVAVGIVAASAAGLPDRLAQALGYRGAQPVFLFDGAVFKRLDYETVLCAYGASGRQQVALAHALWDLVLPASYTLAGLSAVGLLTRRRPRLRWLGALPVVAGSADLVENALIIDTCLRYPDTGEAAYGATAAATRVKWMMILASAGAIGGLLYDAPHGQQP